MGLRRTDGLLQTDTKRRALDRATQTHLRWRRRRIVSLQQRAVSSSPLLPKVCMLGMNFVLHGVYGDAHSLNMTLSNRNGMKNAFDNFRNAQVASIAHAQDSNPFLHDWRGRKCHRGIRREVSNAAAATRAAPAADQRVCQPVVHVVGGHRKALSYVRSVMQDLRDLHLTWRTITTRNFSIFGGRACNADVKFGVKGPWKC